MPEARETRDRIGTVVEVREVEVGIKIKRELLVMQKEELMEVDPLTHGVNQQTNHGGAAVAVAKEVGNHSCKFCFS